MKNTVRNILFSSILVCALGNAQDRQVRKAESFFNDYAYSDAIASYEKLIKKGEPAESVLKNLGDLHFKTGNYSEAKKCYDKLFEIERPNIESEYYIRYALSLKSNGEYEKAHIWMDKFILKNPNDIRALKYSKNKEYLEEIESISDWAEIETLGMNSFSSDFAPAYYNNSLVFSSARDSGLVKKAIHKWNNGVSQSLYVHSEKDGKPFVSKFSKELNTKANESSSVFTRDGKTIYFTRNNFNDGKFRRGKDGFSRHKLYKAVITEDGQWENVVELPFNSDDYSVAHPTLNASESKLYFVSDMPGSIGESDIFYVDITPNGSFGKPTNLGTNINTEGKETFPFISEDNVLYFASNGHPGLGGLDIFATDLNIENNSCVINLGKPINSSQDDFSFVAKNKKGYFASNREDGKGSDDIYAFSKKQPLELICKSSISGIVKDGTEGFPIANSEVKILDNNDVLIAQGKTNSDGTFSISEKYKVGNFKIEVAKKEYTTETSMYSKIDMNDSKPLTISLIPIEKPAIPGTDLVALLEVEPVYFAYNKSDIAMASMSSLDQIINYLNKFNSIKIEVRSHTDSKASKPYNQKLSEERAQSTIAYLISKGIDKSRIIGKGFGEGQLVNDCDSQKKCSDQQHQVNRRSEFIVVE